MKKEFVFQLEEEIQISKKGEFVGTATIVFQPPSMESFDEAADFEQLFMGSLISAGNLFKGQAEDIAKEDDKSAFEELKDNTPSSEEMRMLLTVSQEIKIKDLFRTFKKLAYKTAEVDEETKLKPVHFDRMTRDDAIRMLCEYASFFTFPSLLGGKSAEKSGSETSVTQ